MHFTPAICMYTYTSARLYASVCITNMHTAHLQYERTHALLLVYTPVYIRDIYCNIHVHTHLLVYMSVCITNMYTAHLQYEPTHTLLLVYASMYIYNRQTNRTPATCNQQTHVCPRIHLHILHM